MSGKFFLIIGIPAFIFAVFVCFLASGTISLGDKDYDAMVQHAQQAHGVLVSETRYTWEPYYKAFPPTYYYKWVAHTRYYVREADAQ